MATASSNVRVRRQSGKHVLVLSSSQFDHPINGHWSLISFRQPFVPFVARSTVRSCYIFGIAQGPLSEGPHATAGIHLLSCLRLSMSLCRLGSTECEEDKDWLAFSVWLIPYPRCREKP